MGYKLFNLIFDVFIVLLVLGVSEQIIFDCYADRCNVGGSQQFCSESFRYCRNCYEIKDDCGTSAQPLNCTKYCQEKAVEKALTEKDEREKKSCLVVPIMMHIANGNVAIPDTRNSRVPVGSELVYSCDREYSLEGAAKITCAENGTWNQAIMPYCLRNAFVEKSCLVVPFMLNIANGNVNAPHYNSRLPAGSELMYSCDSGYSLEGAATITCFENGTWSQTVMPYCFQNACIDYKYWTVGLSIFSSMSFMALILLVIRMYRCKGKANAGDISRTNTDDSFDIEAEPLIFVEEDRTHLNNGMPSGPVVASGLEISGGVGIDIPLIPVSPTAPPPEPNNEEGGRDEPPNEDGSSSQDARVTGNARYDSSTEDKKPTEESNEINAVKETAADKEGKSNGTKPLSPRDTGATTELSEDAEVLGPQPVAEKEEDIQSPTTETGQGNKSSNFGLHDVTFSKTDIKRSEAQPTQSVVELSELSATVKMCTPDVNSIQNLKEYRSAEALQAGEMNM